MFFFFKIPTFSRFFVADVPKAAKPLAQIDRVHGIPEQIQVSVKGISTLLIWQSTINPAPIPANASGHWPMCSMYSYIWHLHWPVLGYGLAVDWRIGRWLTVFSVPVVDKWQGYGIVSVILASDWCICLVLVNCCHARLIDILSCHRIVEEIGILLI